MRKFSQFKRMLGVVGIATFLITPIYAESPQNNSIQILQAIANNTYNTFIAINKLPAYFSTLGTLTMSWLSDDSRSDSFINASQGSFATLGFWYNQNEILQLDQQPQVLGTLLDLEVVDITGPGGSLPFFPTKLLQLLPNVNDLSYTSVLGKPPVNYFPTTTYNYISYAAGLNTHHEIPNPAWNGKDKDKQRYTDFFNTMFAIQSFNGYTLSNLYVENKNGNPLTKLQQNLTTSVSDSSWFVKVATEELGKVIRHILLFESQNYVLMTQMVKLQRDLLTAQVMTNTLLMGVSPSEAILLSNAKGRPLGT